MLDDKALGLFFGLATNGVVATRRLGPIGLFREGMDFLTAHPQLREELETSLFNIVDTTGVAREVVRGVLNVAIPELVSRLAPVAAGLVEQHQTADTTGMGLGDVERKE